LKSLGVWGHLLTFGLSVLTTTLFFARYIATSRAEIRKLRLQTRNQFAENLLGERLSCYRECFALLSEFLKVALGFRDLKNGFRPVTSSELSALNARLSDWDSAHALLLSGDAGGRFYQLRACIRDLLQSGQRPEQSDALNEKDFRRLVKHIERVERRFVRDRKSTRLNSSH